MNAATHTTPSSTPVQAPTAKSIPLSRARNTSTGPVIHGRPMSSAPMVGPHQRAASDMTATSTGGTAILNRRSMERASRVGACASARKGGAVFCRQGRLLHLAHGVARQLLGHEHALGQLELGEPLAEQLDDVGLLR